MGFRFWRDRTTLRKSLMLRICRKALKVAKKPRPTYYDAASMLSYMGWIKASNTYAMYKDRVKPYVDVKQLKHIVSQHSKKEAKKENRKEGKKNAKNELADSDRDAGKTARTGGHDQQPHNGIHT